MITIRPLTVDEWELYREVRLQALQSDPGVFGGRYDDERHKSQSEWQKTLANPKEAVFILFDGKKPIGITGIGYDRHNPADNTALMWGSWIHPDYRGRGLSSRLYQARLDWVKDKGDILFVYVGHRLSNTTSKSANQKYGFTYTHEEMTTWPDGAEEPNVEYMKVMNSPWGTFPIETPRLILRPPIGNDLDDLLSAKQETWDQLQTWMGWAKGDGPDRNMDRKMLSDLVDDHISGKDCMLFGFEKMSMRPVIFTGLHNPDWDKGIFEIGYWTRKSAQGKGYAQEATTALTAHAFNELNASKVLIASAVANAASLAVISKCGFTYTHTRPGADDKVLGQERHWFEKTRPAP